jgi:hypothetical protein
VDPEISGSEKLLRDLMIGSQTGCPVPEICNTERNLSSDSSGPEDRKSGTGFQESGVPGDPRLRVTAELLGIQQAVSALRPLWGAPAVTQSCRNL